MRESESRVTEHAIELEAKIGGRRMGSGMELRIPSAILCASLAIISLFVIYNGLPGVQLTCNTADQGGPWTVEASVTINNKESSGLGPSHGGENREIPQQKSIAQFLQEKIESGGLERDQEVESDELAGLDASTRALLVELMRSLKRSSAVAAPGQEKEDWGLLKFDYGVKRVVKRIVVCSAYRTSLRDFTVITLSPDFTLPTSNPDFRNVPLKDPAVTRTCTWLEDGNAGAPFFGSEREMNETGRTVVSNGTTTFQWIGETHGASYDVMLIHCTFPEPVGTDLHGGFLYLNVSHGYDSGQSSAPTELAPVYHEGPETLNASMFEPPGQYQYEFAYCSAPVFTSLTASHVKQFLMYHYALLNGAVHFFIYDSQGIDLQTMVVLQPLIDAGIVTVVNFEKESEYDTWYHSQDLAINDCLYRNRDLAKWVLSWDMDEYLHVRPPLTLPALLEQHKDAPWISFGKIDFSLGHCAPYNSSTDWAVERMLYREGKPICGELCNGDRGARKWMANPRKVQAGKIHAIVDSVKGVVLSTNIARMNHYRGLVAPRGAFTCQKVRDPLNSNSTLNSNGKSLLWSDAELASLVKATLKSSVEALPMFGDHGTS